MSEPTPQEWKHIVRLVRVLEARGVTAAQAEKALAYWRQHRAPSWQALDAWLGLMAASPWAGGRTAQKGYRTLQAALQPLWHGLQQPQIAPARGAIVLGAIVRHLKKPKNRTQGHSQGQK